MTWKEQWSMLPLSLLGRVESICMNVLPRILYLFQMLPIEIPKSKNLDKIIFKFIWQKKHPRIRLKTLQLSKVNGGWAAQMKPLIAWIQNSTYTRWLNIEKNLWPEPLQNLPFLDAPIKELAEWSKITLKTWNKIQTTFGLPKLISSQHWIYEDLHT